MDKLSAERRSENMRRIKSKGMKPELTVRKLVHRLGFRFRLHRKDLPGTPDLTFPGRKKVIFVHGCFWHQHSDPACKNGRPPASNLEYWTPKLERNRERDAKAVSLLSQKHWDVMVIWECETRDLETLSRRIMDFLNLDCAFESALHDDKKRSLK